MKKPKQKTSSDHDLLNDLSGHERVLESDTTGLFRRFRWLLAGGIVIAIVLVIWSYLNFLCATHVASSNDSANWLLSLFYGDRCNRQSGISNLPNAGNDNDQQQLSLSGTTIALSNGGSVDLSFLTGTPGTAGTNGSNGLNGTSGSNGAPGSTGATGPAGPGVSVPSCLPTEVVFANGTSFSCVPIPAATVLSAQNGTSLVGTAVELGLNPLLHNTTIPQNNFTLSMTGGVGSGLIQNYIDGTSGTTHGIESRDDILGSIGTNGSIMYSSPNPSALPSGGTGSYVYSFDNQSGYGASDGLGNIANNFAFPGSFGAQAVNTAGDNAFAGGNNGNYSINANYSTGQSANISVNSSPATIDMNGSDGAGDFAAIRIDGTSSQVRLQETNSSGANGFFNLDSFNNIGQWFMNDNLGGVNAIDMLPGLGQTAIYSQGTLGNNTLTLNQTTGLVFDTNIAPVFAPNMFSVSQNGDVTFDRELRPGGNAGNAGEVLVSQGAGLPPVWSAAAGGGITTINGQTGPAIILNSTSPISTTTLANTVTFGLTPCAINQSYVYSGATWICQNAVLSAQNGTSLVGNAVELGLNPLLHATNISLANQNFTIEGLGGSIGHGLGIGTSGAGARLNLNSWGGGFPNGFGAALKLTDTGGFPAAYFADNTNAGFLIATNNDAAFHMMMVGAGGSAGSYTLNSDQLGRVYIDQSGPTNSLANAHLYVRGMAGMATTSFQTNTIDNITEWGNVFNTAISVVDSQGHLGIGTNTVPVGKVASFAGDVNITGVVDPTALLFSVQTPSSYNPALPGNNGYKIGINTGTSQLPIFVSPLTDARRIFEVRDTSNTAFFSADSLNNRIGIGTTNPVARLTVLGTDNTTSLDASVVIRNLAVDPNAFSKLILSSGSFGGELGAAQSSSITSGYLPGLYMRARNATDAITFSVGDTVIGAGNGPSVSIVPNGGVGYLGVANSAPATAIHAGNSTVPISSPNASIRSEDTAGYCEIQGSNGLNCVSDARLKTNVVTLSGSLDKIMQLNGVHYNWKVDPNNNLQTGFIAQDVEAIFPELVKTDATTGMKSVNYDRFTPYIVQAMKEQQAQISNLKTIVGVTDTPTQPSVAEDTSLTDRIAALEAHNISVTNTQTTQNTQSVATSVFNGGVVTGDVEFQGEATFIAATTFESTTVFKGDATFEGDVKISGNLNVSDNTAGTTTLTAGKTRIHVGFAQPHTIAPKVTVTAHGANRIDYGTENVTTTGFDIVIDPVATKNITFDWTALEK